MEQKGGPCSLQAGVKVELGTRGPILNVKCQGHFGAHSVSRFGAKKSGHNILEVWGEIDLESCR